MRDLIVCELDRAVQLTDACLIAFAIMSNHFHLVVRQGTATLAQLMQPLCRAVALGVHRSQKVTGRVFGGPFFASPCQNADYLRAVIVYTHLNPMRAGMCTELDDYAWTSHAAYCNSQARGIVSKKLTPAVELFASSDIEQARGSYLQVLEWRRACDALSEEMARPSMPVCMEGDAYWRRHFKSVLPTTYEDQPDLRDVVLKTLRNLPMPLLLEELRLRRSTRAHLQAREEVVRQAVLARHRNVDIARFINVHESTVSRLAARVSVRGPVWYRPR
ncbi:MAG: transposase [Pseudomonas sp.]